MGGKALVLVCLRFFGPRYDDDFLNLLARHDDDGSAQSFFLSGICVLYRRYERAGGLRDYIPGLNGIDGWGEVYTLLFSFFFFFLFGSRRIWTFHMERKEGIHSLLRLMLLLIHDCVFVFVF